MKEARRMGVHLWEECKVSDSWRQEAGGPAPGKGRGGEPVWWEQTPVCKMRSLEAYGDGGTHGEALNTELCP